MPWTAPKTWTPAEIVTASALNTHLRDNLNTLLAGRPVGAVVRTGSSDYATSSSSFVDVDATHLKLDLTLNGSRVLVIATALISGTLSGSICYLDWAVDGSARAGGANGLVQSAIGTTGANFQAVTALGIFSGLAPGAHTFTLQYRGNGTGDAKVLNDGPAVVLFALEI